jgi:competence protein ComEA
LDGNVPPWRTLEQESIPAIPPEDRATPRIVPWTIVLGAILVVSVAAGAIVVVATSRAPASIGTDAGPGLSAIQADSPGEVVVEVEGAVARPGVYRLLTGSRVADAIAAAGGYSPRVDAASAERDVNLAAILADGERIVVPSRDASPGGPSPPSGAAGFVDLNRATQAELEALPGVGPVTAAKIIAAREERPLRSIHELIERKVVGKATFEKIRHLVSAGN